MACLFMKNGSNSLLTCGRHCHIGYADDIVIRLVAFDKTVAKAYDAVRVLGNIVFVCNDNDGIA